MNYDLVVIGGGAAGFFTAINVAKQNPHFKIAILERGKDVLQKVRVSGGGRCNVTHACFDIEKLGTYYPRGADFLKQAFQQFNPKNTIEWFENEGVPLKTEADGRMFPTSNSSESIISCFLNLARKHKIDIKTHTRVEDLEHQNAVFSLQTNQENLIAKNVLVASGSDTAVWALLGKMGFKLISPVPSLFTFNIKDERIDGLMGLSVPQAILQLKIPESSHTSGALLITHWGVSGPAALKLSAWEARSLHAIQYKTQLIINWTGKPIKDVETHLKAMLGQKKYVQNQAEFDLPIRLWKNLCKDSGIREQQNWAEMGKKQVQKLSEELCQGLYQVHGKSTFKEEFVTAGGVSLDEMNVETFATKKIPNLYMAGEVLNIDALTGGFNFQAAWTGAFLAAKSIV